MKDISFTKTAFTRAPLSVLKFTCANDLSVFGIELT